MPNLNPLVYVVDPDPSIRASLEVLIRRTGWKAETFASASEFLARPRLVVPSCLLLEVNLPDSDVFELEERFAAERKETPVIVMAGQADIPMAVRAMKAGAVEFLLKPLDDDALLAAVRHASAQSHDVLQREAELLDLQQRKDSLSGREREVMMGVVAGRLNKQVGAELGISLITVKAHRGRMMRKMGADSLAELVTMALQLHLPVAGTNRNHRPMAVSVPIPRMGRVQNRLSLARGA